MRLIPTSRPRRIALLGAVAVLAGVLVSQRQLIGDVYGYLFPAGIVDDAEARTSAAAPPAATDVPPPTTQVPPTERPTGVDPAVALEPVLDVAQPSAVVDPPGPGPVLVSTLDGRVLAADLDAGTSEVVLDLSDRISSGGERGLLGMAVDPDGERLYLDYTDPDGDTDVVSIALVDGLPDGGPDDLVVHLEVGQPYRNHNAGHLAFGPDGLLWIGLGDGGSANDPGDVAQDPDNVLGKMLRVEPLPDGGLAVPASNPDWGGRPEIWGIGLRNPWRYAFDRVTNRLWVADVGQNEFEEVTVVDPAADLVNFGWDRLEGRTPFEGDPGPDLTDPVVVYDHGEGCSITGGYVYRGEAIASLWGWYLFGDFCGGWIRAVPADDPTVEPTELVAEAGPALSFAELEDGELLFLTQDGIRRIVAA